MHIVYLSLVVVTLAFPTSLIASDAARWGSSDVMGNRYTPLPYNDGRGRMLYPTPTPVPSLRRITPPVPVFPTPKVTPGIPSKLPVPVFPTPRVTPGISPRLPVPVFPTPKVTPGIPPKLPIPPKPSNPYGFKPPTGPASNAFVFWYNMYTGQTWYAPTGGWSPPDGNWVTGVSPNIVSKTRNPYNFRPVEVFGYPADQRQIPSASPVLWINTKTYEGWWAPDSSYQPPNRLWVVHDQVPTRATLTNFGFRLKGPVNPGKPGLVPWVFQSFYNVITGQVVTFSHGGMQPPNIEWRVGEGPGILWPRNPYGFREGPSLYSPVVGYRPAPHVPTYWHNMTTEEGWWAPSQWWEPPTSDWSRNVRPGSRTGHNNPFGFVPPPGPYVTMVITPWINLHTGQMWTFSHGGHTPPNSQWIMAREWPMAPEVLRQRK
jgi:hypothetical protein